MVDGINKMFDGFQIRLGKIKKKDYEIRFESFYNDNFSCFEKMFEAILASDDKHKAAADIATLLADTVEQMFAKRGKVPSNLKMDLTLFMIYYVFPSILKMNREDSTLLADAIRDEWRVRTNNPAMDYASYDDIYSEFKEKLFGFF